MKRVQLARERGIVLVTVLFLTILISMFIGSAILVGPRTLGLADSEDGALTASAAAESGMQYAIMRIRENPNWRGDGGGTVVSSPDFTVVEDSGYVWGHLRAADGSGSMFRIRFNYEDGADGPDKLNNGTGPRIQTEYVSINNLFNANSAIVPRASKDSKSSVDDPNQGDYEVPAYGMCLIVEGLAGPAVRDFDPTQPNPQGFAQTKVLEGTFVASNLSDVATDAAAMSNSDLVAIVEDKKAFTVEAKDDSPSIRSRGNVSVTSLDGSNADYVSEGTVYTKDATLQANYDAGKTVLETEDVSNPFYELAWDDLKTADPSGPSLAAGTYVWWDDGSLHYYDMEYSDYTSHIRTNATDVGEVIFSGGNYASGFTPPANLEINTDGKNNSIIIKGDLFISPVDDGTGVTKAEGIAVIPREGAPEEPPDPTAQATAAGPALAKHLATNVTARTAFFENQLGDTSDRTDLGTARGWNLDVGTGTKADIGWSADGTFVDVRKRPSLEIALAEAFTEPTLITATEVSDYATKFGVFDDNGDLNLGTGDTTTPEDLEVTFEPAEGESATLSANGDIRIGAKLKGQGASITSGGTLDVVGAGADLSAVANAEDGVNMYAKGDITLSTLKEKNGSYEFKDIKLKGLVYTWGDFTAKLGNSDATYKRGKLALEGTLVAFGGDPADGIPKDKLKGRVAIHAKEVNLKFNPAYLLGVMKTLPDNIEFARTAWTTHK